MNFSACKKWSTVAVFFVFAFLFIAVPIVDIQAQTASDISVQLSPESPGLLEEVTAKIVSFSVDLDRLNISWTLNGKVLSSGIGKKTFSFKTGGAGSATRISVSITNGAGRITKSLTILPGNVDTLWQVIDGYSPPFYFGKTLPVSGSNMKIVAMPNLTIGGNSIKPGSLVYKWSRNHKAINDASGYGKNYLIFRNDYLDPSEEVGVEVSSLSGGASTQGKIFLDMGQPLVLFYENSPLQGIRYEQALFGSFDMKNVETKITAEPYFFSVLDKRNGNIKYDWQLNGKTVPGLTEDQSSLVLRSDGGAGATQISLAVSHAKRILQSAASSFTINFGNR